MEISVELLDAFKLKLKNGKSVFGLFAKSPDPAFVEIAGYSGFDFVILDMEHGPTGFNEMQDLIRAAILTGIVPIIRTSNSEEISISRSLDIGALGVQIPHIISGETAETCVAASRFYPEGQRGVCRFVMASEYSSIPREQYFSKANEILIIVQIEGKEALNKIDEILNVRGIDIVFIGPYALSQSMGVPGQIEHPMVIDSMSHIVDMARRRNIVVGTFTDTVHSTDSWRKAGVQYLPYSVDMGIYYEACSNLVKKLKS